jgi:UDP-glucose-4-epimerase GalE
MKRVLVTGGAGYVGSHAAKALAKAGIEPVTYDDLSEGHREAVRFGPLIEGSLSDRAALVQALREPEIDAVLHFAAKAYVGESMSMPAKYFENNVVGSLHLLEAMREAGVSKLVFSSSCASYGLPERVPITEDHPQRPVNPYGESKLFVERALGWYDHAYDFRSVSLRYFNAAGADPEGECGEHHDPETHLIPIAIQVARGERAKLEVLGTDYETPDGTCVRDYIHVSDLADAHVAALEYLARGGATTALNLGTGHGHSVREVIRAVEAVSGRTLAVNDAPRRAGDPATLVADASRAKEVLGFVPRHAELRAIVESAWRWHARND